MLYHNYFLHVIYYEVESNINHNDFNDCCCAGYCTAICMGGYKYNLVAPVKKKCYNNVCHSVSSINCNFIGFNLYIILQLLST